MAEEILLLGACLEDRAKGSLGLLCLRHVVGQLVDFACALRKRAAKNAG